MPLPAAFSYAIEVVDTSGLSEEDWLGIGGKGSAVVMSLPSWGFPHLPPCGIFTTTNAAARMLSRRKTTG